MIKPRLYFPLLAMVGVGLAFGGYYLFRPRADARVYRPRPAGTLTFNKQIAPIIFQNCSSCHRPGQSAPFALLSYEDVRRHARQIVEVTEGRYMPPWMPSPGLDPLLGERRLTVDQLGLLAQWVSEGTSEGDPGDLPALPKWREGWQLGEPDLVVRMKDPYTLRAEGKDLYRNFVIPIPTRERRYVRAVEFDPGNPKIVHHAFIRLDPTRQSQRRDEQDPEPGFDGIHAPTSAAPPEGYFLSWQPGKMPSQPPAGFGWVLEPRTDVVLQLHLQPSGKPETIQSRIAFYFADRPPVDNPLKIWLSSYHIDIPAGVSNYVLTDAYTLPADVDLLGILPHAHYLAKELTATALFPDRTSHTLLHIRQWDFNWQGDYRYAKPVFLPRGTTLQMNYVYDNSEHNVKNQNHPPRRVQYGLQSTDEMGELWLQVLPRQPDGRGAISRDYQTRVIQDSEAYNEYLLALNPKDAQAHNGLGKAFYFLSRPDQAKRQFLTAIACDPIFDEPYYFLGLLHRRNQDLVEAQNAFAKAAQLNPENSKAHGNLGLILLELRDFSQAEAHFRQALQTDPNDPLAWDGLGVALLQTGKIDGAEAAFRKALQLAPGDEETKKHLDAVLRSKARR